jgi:hypothetical protein
MYDLKYSDIQFVLTVLNTNFLNIKKEKVIEITLLNMPTKIIPKILKNKKKFKIPII